MTRCRLWRGLLAGFVGWVTLNVAGVISCGSGGPTDPPTPGPTPTASATPSPINRIFPSRIVMAAEGRRWDPPLHGAVVCCASGGPVDEGLRDGWELISTEAAQRFSAHGVNVTHLRTGPYQGADYSRLRPTVEMLGSLGIHAEVTLIDGWVLRHGLSLWGEGCEITERAPRAHHVEHIRNVVRESLSPWTFYEVGNEISLCRGVSEAWYRGVADAARAAGAQVVGGDADYDFLDYQVEHGFRLPIPSEKPVHLNESDNERHLPQDWLSLFQNAEEVGGTVYYWPGPEDDASRMEVLRLLKGWLDAGKPRANACSMPAECPTLTKWGGHEHTCEGNVCLLDSTPKFSGRNRPCNDEHNAPCSCTGEDEPPTSAAWRRCEDPRGPEWSGVLRTAGNPFQAKAQVGALVRICPRPDLVDSMGKSVEAGPNPCTQFVVEYR